ncbi:ABC transporter permease subunit [Devosia sp. 2618]|uniref:ABC transporter permease subunit n=1 Tax=Devosia sp. 2618 TaxID=3156454 RepID=UPI003396EFB5
MRLHGQILATPITLWLLVAFAAPFLVVILMSLHPYADPFGPLFVAPSIAQFALILGDHFYLGVVWETVALGMVVTALSAVLGFPLALWLVSVPGRWRPLAFMVILIPLLTNVVVRSLGIVLLLAPDGLINVALGFVGIPPITNMLFNHFAVAISLAQVFMPFIVLALYDNLQGTSPRVFEAAESLGASKTVNFWTVRLPLALPGLRAGMIIVFMMSSTAYVSARILGGGRVWTTGMLVWQEAIANLNTPTAAALALVMTVACIAFAAICIWVFSRLMPWQRNVPASASFTLPPGLVRVLDVVGPVVSKLLLFSALVLLLMPLLLVCVQSFNDVSQGTLATFKGFTLKWYEIVFLQGPYIKGFINSLQLGAAATVIALALALPAAFALSRYRFLGIGALMIFWTLPLSLPGVAIGVGMLRLLQYFTAVPTFIGLLALHVVLILPFCLALLTTSIQQLDRSQEEAAQSLGANGPRRFFLVIIPNLMPGLVASAIITFLMSFGEVTVTSFLTTARMTTLPVIIYAEANNILEPTVHAVSASMIAVTLLALFLINLVFKVDRLHVR